VQNPSRSAIIKQAQVANLQKAFQADVTDLGVGLYNPSTGEIQLASFDELDSAGFGQGHQALADFLGITDTSQWQGFTLDANGGFAPISHFNRSFSGTMAMPPADEATVLQALQQAGLVH
jgi:hypothetical protein